MTTTLILIVIFLAVLFSKKNTENEHEYHASFGDKSDHFSLFNHGFSVGPYALTKRQSFQNAICLGATGSGKSQSVITRSIISCARGRSSLVIFDPSGAELFSLMSSYLERKGYRVLQYNFMDSKYSECFNPLSSVRTVSDAQKQALILIRNTIGESKSDPFWENAAIQLIALMIRLLVFHYEPKYRTLQNVLRLIETLAVDGDAISKIMLSTKDEGLLDNYKAAIVMGEKTLQGVIATARTALNLWNDPEVIKTTSKNTLCFDELRDDRYPTAIFITNPLKDLEYCKPISCLFIQALFDYVLSKIPAKNDRSIFIILEEAATMQFPNFSKVISNVRKFSCGILLCLQDQEALISQYGSFKAHEIATNCVSRIYLKGSPLKTCKEISQMMGKYSIPDQKGTRELMSVDEVRLCEQAIVLIGNSPPILIDPVPLHKSLWYGHLARATPIQVPEKDTSEPAILNFNK